MDRLSPTSRYEFMIHTYGCKVNTYDTGLLQRRLEAASGSSALNKKTVAGPAHAPSLATPNVPRVHILNTCAVTAEATREAAKQVRRLKSKDPFSRIVVTGCGAQVDGETFDQMPGVDLVVANSHKGLLERLLDEMFKGQLESKVYRSNIFRKEDLEAGGGIEQGHTRTFLKIQDGCNSFCTYCVIPFARGKSRSIPVRELIQRINELAHQGVQEFVLTGVHIGDYEDQVGEKKLFLHDLVREILAKTSVPRIRLSSLEPPELTDELMALFQNSRLCPHFHMSIQSANTEILRGMKRRYSAKDVEEALLKIRRQIPNAFIGMDVIVGFPGETAEHFADTYQRLERSPWSRIHVFPYSERPGTKAAKFEGSVDRAERVLRSQRLRDLSSLRLEAEARRQMGQLKRALILNSPGREATGLTHDYWPVQVDSIADLSAFVGREVNVEIIGYVAPGESRMDGFLKARLVDVGIGVVDVAANDLANVAASDAANFAAKDFV